METFLHSVSSVTIILLLTAIGYVCSALGWIHEDTKSFLSKFLMRLAVPVVCMYSLSSNLTREMLAASGLFLLVPAIATALLLAAAYLAGRLLKLPRGQLGVFMTMCAMSNSMFIGYPMCVELFGEACTPYVMMFYFVNTSFVQIFGMALIRYSGGRERLSLRNTLLSLLKAPTTIGLFIGVLLVVFDVRLPSVIMSCAGYVNNTVTPLALLLTGHIIYGIGLRELRLTPTLGAAMIGRFLLSPLLSLALCLAFGVTGLGRNVIVVQMAMPVVTQTVVAAAEYGADDRLAAQGAALSTIACFVVTPVLMMAL